MSDSTIILNRVKDFEKQLASMKATSLKENTDKNFLKIKEEYWTHIILPIFIPVLAFCIGRLYSTFNDKIKKLKTLKEQQRFLLTWVSLVREPIERQAEIYEEYATNLKELKKEQLIALNLHIDKLKLIDSVSLVSFRHCWLPSQQFALRSW